MPSESYAESLGIWRRGSPSTESQMRAASWRVAAPSFLQALSIWRLTV